MSKCVRCGYEGEDGFFCKHDKICGYCEAESLQYCTICDRARKNVAEYEIYARSRNGEFVSTGEVVECCQRCYYDNWATPDEINDLIEDNERRESDPESV